MRGKEDSLQIAVMDYLRYQYPDVLAIHVPNGGSRNKIEGAKLKRMGVKAGCPDVLIFRGCDANGLAIELKVKPNRPTDLQLAFLQWLQKEGWETAICYDIFEAKKIIDNYLNKKMKQIHTR